MTNTQGKQMCTCKCGHTHQINDREISMYKGLVQALWQVLQWCEHRGIHEFKISEVRHLYSQVSYSRFGDWEKFGGLVYQTKRGEYGLNLERCRAFFAGRYKIPKVVYKNPITKENRPGDYVTIDQLPHLKEFLDANRQFIATYRVPEPKPVTAQPQPQQMLI